MREIGEGDERWPQSRRLVAAFATATAAPPRILVAKIGQDGHDRGQKVIASAFADLGFDVIDRPVVPDAGGGGGARDREGRHIVGISTLAAGHLTLVPALKRALEEGGRPDIMVVVGGVVPPEDYEALRDAGAAAIFPPGTSVVDAAATLIEELNRRLGYEPPTGDNFPPA